MPASDISRLSISGAPRSNLAATIAKDIAHREILLRIQSGQLSQTDQAAVAREYRSIYSQEYYKYYALYCLHDQSSQQARIIYVPTENPSAKKFFARHTVVNFSQQNCFIHVHRNCITVGRINYPIDEDVSLETKEAFLTAWPGPMDRHDDHLKRKVTDYIDTLWQHDSQRRIKYCSGTNDDQRKTILKLLTELLHRNGSIDAPGITRLLLKPEQTEIQKDESNRKPLETLQKYLLLGKRGEAIKFAKSRKLWDHAQCLAFLDKYQPPDAGNYVRDGLRLKEDSIVQLNDEYIGSVDGILNTVYRSLLNRLLQCDPESVNIITHPNVANNSYEFAILSANDCDMEFDQSNEIFKLIMAVKQAILNPNLANSHLISLGYTTVDSYDANDDLSYRSHLSFRQGDTSASRTLTISNIDMLVLNEIWEYCLNLARGTCNPTSYEYIINLVPYKLMFASKLLDFGLHDKFADYLSSIRNALVKAKAQPSIERDQFYDWDTIERCVEHLSRIWDIFRMSPETISSQPTSFSPETTLPLQPNNIDFVYNQPASYDHGHSLFQPVAPNELQSNYIDPSPDDYTSLPYQNESALTTNQNFSQAKQNIPPPIFNQKLIQEEVQDFNPEPMPPQMDQNEPPPQQQAYNDYSNGPSRRQSASQSMEMPVFSPPSYGPPGISMSDRNQRAMTSSSPVNKARDSMQSNPVMGDSFSHPFSPINQYDDRRESDPSSRRTSAAVNNIAAHDSVMASESSGNLGSSSNNNINNKSQPAGDQQSGFFSSFAKALLPKSSSKQMILPDDSNKPIVFDSEKNAWVDTTQKEGPGNNDSPDAPPMMNITTKPPSYSFADKTSKKRYPKPQF